MKTILAVMRAAAQAIATAIVATNTLREKNELNRYLLLSAVLVIALLLIYEPIRVTRKERADARRRLTERKVHSALGSALVTIEQVTALRADEVGIQAYLMEKKGILRRKRLVRLARLRLNAGQPMSDVVWYEDKGVVGKCWSLRRYFDYNFDIGHSGEAAWDKATWQTLPPEVTMNLEWEEFEQQRGRYGIVAAHPIVNQTTGALLGILAVDALPGNYNNMASGPVRLAGALAAQQIAHLLPDT